MPVMKCPNGKYRIGAHGRCMYTTKPAAERAYAAYRAQLHSTATELVAIAKAGKKTGPGKGWHGPPVGTHAPSGKAKLPVGVKVTPVGKPSPNAVRMVEHIMAQNPPKVARLAKRIKVIGSERWDQVCRRHRLKPSPGCRIDAFTIRGEIFISERSAKPEVVNHELGHLVLNSSRMSGRGWISPYERSPKFDRHTRYSKVSPREGFAESYASYISTGGVARNPEYALTYLAVAKVLSGI